LIIAGLRLRSIPTDLSEALKEACQRPSIHTDPSSFTRRATGVGGRDPNQTLTLTLRVEEVLAGGRQLEAIPAAPDEIRTLELVKNGGQSGERYITEVREFPEVPRDPCRCEHTLDVSLCDRYRRLSSDSLIEIGVSQRSPPLGREETPRSRAP
jgi:hypothetical protein